MKAKLIKKDNRYFLTDTSSGWWIGDTDHKKVKAHKGEQILSKLSLKNCQAIERGYNLDELANVNGYHDTSSNELYKEGFIDGFQKALELMGDKKFSEEDMIRASDWYVDTKGKKSIDELIQSLQQKEWDVEIIEFTADDLKSINNEWHKLGEPKLDENGCLILIRI